MPESLVLEPIGVLRSPFKERVQAPRQPAVARGVEGTIELFAGRGLEFAVSDLERWTHIWVLFWFHQAQGWRPKVHPPRSRTSRGVLATRAPHRPNPIGLSAVELVSVSGLTLKIRNVDVLDGTPVLDIKPYVAYTDAIAEAGAGWLAAEPEDPGPRYHVELAPLARRQADFLSERWGVELAPPMMRLLELGPTPHPYRRIRREGDTLRLAHKDWRARFCVVDDRVTVLALATGYRAKELSAAARRELDPHRAFVREFGYPGDGALERNVG